MIPSPPLPSADPLEDLKKDVQLQRALDVIKTMRVLDQQRGTTQAQSRTEPAQTTTR